MFAHERSLVEKYRNRPFALLGVNEDPKRETFVNSEKEHKLNWRSWWDEKNNIATAWKVDGFPTLFLIDHKGKVRWQHEGVPDFKKMEETMEKLVQEAESEGGKQAALSRR
jgi:peroxiredoxin